MKQEKRVLAFDFGASSGRAILGVFDGNAIRLEEVHRFENNPVNVCGTLYWDVLRLFYEIKQGLTKAKDAGGFDSVGIDTWGVDFGLLDKNGRLLENPVHYRDARTTGMLEEAFRRIDREDFYRVTGIQFMEINTAFQLLSLHLNRPELLERAETLLLTPDLFQYFLTGQKNTEYTIATTTQLLDASAKTWSREVLQKLGLPSSLFPNIVEPGTVTGRLSPELCEELGLPPADVVSVASHDTASAVLAVPAQEKDFIFISCGTWSLFGTELDAPLIGEAPFRCNLTNEGGYGGTTTFLKNIIGLWLIQESRRQWRREGKDYSYSELERLALEAPAFQSFIDPDAPEFVPPGDLPGRVRAYCQKTGQPVPQTVGETMRCIYESLALKYRFALEQIKACTKKSYSAIHMVGGGVKDGLLCRMTACATNCTVKAGPVEATVLGNLAAQLIACGTLASIREARSVIAASQPVRSYAPTDAGAWESAYQRFLGLL